ncbi:MAG: DNA-directed RNA polymerase sigma-70 factor [Chloroflexota bacterium]|nr:sigma-70 family RNA polymerase sigma factor [Chloroflexota bacterium]NOG62060.1 sigma-70 family RNA polymerase sigma factor [Chloroflexota bacterium]GIK62353.1 MAG: DNA-directed RNA polymerase sigma-70 factor [Chloroflexota bacterium]
MPDNTAFDETDLINRIKLRDQSALSELYQRFGGLVYGLAMRVLQNAGFAEEVTQDIFLKIWDQPDSWDSTRGKLLNWLMTVTRYTAIDRLRKEQRRPSWSAVDIEDVLNMSSKQGLLDEQDTMLLRTLIQQLPSNQTEAIELAFFGGMSHSEIAAQLNLPLGTVKTRLRLGLEKLKTMWLEAIGQPNE